MASKAIRGITVEIGGDTTKLGKAIENSEKQSRSLQVELKQIEKLLKFDPTNTELLIQKQNVLADMISETSKKLNTMKEAEAQVIAQFERGEIAEDQLRAFQREIMQTEKDLGNMQAELRTATRNLEEFGDNNGVAKEETAKLEKEIREQNEALEAEKKALKEAEQAQKDHEKAVKEAKEELADFKEKASGAFDSVKTGATVVGGAVVATGGYALKLSTDFDQAFNTLITRTGASKEEMNGLNESMERVYANNFGENIQDVAESMATVKTNTKLSGDELENATERAILLRDTFEFDVNESTRSAKMLMDQYGMSAEEAYNLIAQGAQNGLDKNGDLLDTINEYGVHFSGLGLSAEDMFNMLVNGAEGGTFSVDKLGDAVKEFGIRVKDGSDGTSEAFKTLGLDVDDTSMKFAKGGEGAKEALSEVTTALFNMDDPLKQNQVGVALFGTMWEDLGVEGVKALMNLEGEVSNSKDALNEINSQKYDDIGSALQGLGRTLETDVIQPLGEELKPVVEDAISYVQENGPQIKEVVSNLVDKVGEFVGFIVDNGTTILSVITGIGAGLLVWNVASMISSVVGAIKAYKTANEGATIAQALFNAVLNANPIVLLVTVITAVIVAIVTFIATNENARAKIVEIWNKIKEVVGNVVDAIVKFFTVTIPEKWNAFLSFCSNFINKIVTFFSELPGKIWTWLVNLITKIVQWRINLHNQMVNGVKKIITAVVNFFKELPNKIAYAIGFVIGKLILWCSNVISWIKTNVPKIITSVVNFFKELPGKIWTFLVNVVTRIGTWCVNMKDKAVNGVRTLITNVITFFRELPGKIWSAIVGAVTRVATWGSNMKDKAVTAIRNLVSNVVSTAKSLPGKIGSAISGAISKIASWGSQMLSKAKTAIKNVASAITGGLKSVPSKLGSIGKDIVTGLWNGIKNATSWIKDKVGGFAKNILKGMKDALGIKSPSRVFRDQVGKYIAEGIGTGITENGDNPIDALKELGDDMASQELALNGATINRKLMTTFTAGEVGVMSTNEALLSKLDGIYDRLNRLQIVLDTGTLVGEAIDKIDAGLATRQLLSARGV